MYMHIWLAFVHACVHVFVPTCTHVHAHTCVHRSCIWRTEVDIRRLAWLLSSFLRQCHPLRLELDDSARLDGQWSPGINVFVSSALSLDMCAAVPVFLHECWGPKLRSSCLGDRHLMEKTISQALSLLISHLLFWCCNFSSTKWVHQNVPPSQNADINQTCGRDL